MWYGRVGSLGATVVGDTQVVDAMDGDAAIVRVVHRVGVTVGVAHVANHVEVDRVAAEAEGLAGVPHLDVLDASGERLVPLGVHHDVRAILVELREGRRALHHHVAREQADVRAKLDRVAAGETAGRPEVRVQQRHASDQRETAVFHRHRRRLSLLHRAVGRRRRDEHQRAVGPVDRLPQPQPLAPRERRVRERRPGARHGRTMQVERAIAAAEHLGTVHGQLIRFGRAV